MSAPPRSLSLVAVVLAIAVLAVDARVVFGGKTWADVRYHTEIAPPRLAAASAVHELHLPAWWDGTGLGVPLAAEPSHGAMYPAQWLPTTPRGFDLFVVLHLAWAALGVAVWARSRASEEAALVAGLLAATAGIATSMALRGALPGLAHLPWLGAATSALVRGDPGTRARAWSIAAVAGLLGLVGLAGSGGALIDAVLLVVVLGARKKSAAAIAAAVGCGLAIACLQWIPAAVLSLQGNVAGARITSLPLARLIELIVPGSFGARDLADGVDAIAGHAPWAPSLFAGAAVLALAAVRIPAPRTRLALVMYALLVLIAGRGLPTGWPAWMGPPDLHLAALILVLAAHAGAGIDALIAGERRAIRALAVGAACTAVAVLALVALRSRSPASAGVIERAIVDGCLGLACLVGALLVAARRVPGVRGPQLGRATPVLLALLVLPSVGAMPLTAPLANRALVDEPGEWARAIIARRGSPLDDAYTGPPQRVFRPAYMFDAPDADNVPAADRDARLGLTEATISLAGAHAWRWRLALARTEDPARARAFDAAWLASAAEGGALLDRFGIELAVLPATLVNEMRVTPGETTGIPQLGTRGKWTLAALPVAPLAAVLRGNLWTGSPEDALGLLFPVGGHTGVLRGTIVLEGRGASRPDAGPPLPCAIGHWTAGDIALQCTTDRDGFAAISSAAAPGWSVTVDHQPQAWVTADALRRATPVPAGTHHLHWTYATPGQLPGLLAALAGLLALAGVLVSSKPTAPPPEPEDVN